MLYYPDLFSFLAAFIDTEHQNICWHL